MGGWNNLDGFLVCWVRMGESEWLDFDGLLVRVVG